ncbi:hypothetical protein [Rhizobium sp. TRM95796]|uniref:hypothetical protein n=1 Tax=Rhizobium sp. TRM95796 TaxID=2979862 RepID=UPI0021E816F6|nr:hypothetical protein [Rhizobium sp. TRM95796]MCV3764906.1 hypothetical protein [Rhizobium sp. TRM95796]
MPRLPLLLMVLGLLAGLISLPGAWRAPEPADAVPAHHAMMQHDHAAMMDNSTGHGGNHDGAAEKCAAWCLASLLSLPAEPRIDITRAAQTQRPAPSLQARLIGRDLAPGLEPPIASFV